MKDSLIDLGVKVIDPKDEIFDPKYHEVLYTTENETIPDNKILEVISKGFIVDNKVLKPARVVISKVPKKAEENEKSN
jgi:molecular chaperone GrpE